MVLGPLVGLFYSPPTVHSVICGHTETLKKLGIFMAIATVVFIICLFAPVAWFNIGAGVLAGAAIPSVIIGLGTFFERKKWQELADAGYLWYKVHDLRQKFGAEHDEPTLKAWARWKKENDDVRTD